MSKIVLTIFLLLIQPCVLFSQEPINPDYFGYIEKYKTIAVREMKEFHIPASIILAQGIIESNCGKSSLATEANNHFGVKCHQDWTGETYLFDDDEKQECFRKYSSAEDSYRDHSLFLVKKQRYAALFSLDITDYTGWAMGLKQAGYATNPDYPKLLIRMIELNKLYQYDDTTRNFDRENYTVSTIVKKSIDISSQTEDESIDKRLFDTHYSMPSPDSFKKIKTSKLGRPVYMNNGIPFIFIKKGDTWYSIAAEFGIYIFQVYKENDMQETDKLSVGQIIYLEPKKRKSNVKTHVVKPYETLFSISQLYGVKMKELCKYNNLTIDEKLKVGNSILLSKQTRFFGGL